MTPRRNISLIITALLLGGAAHVVPAAAQEIDPALEYQECLTAAQDRPEQGFERALGWAGLGGGAAADHCAAVALIGLGQYEEAARRLEKLADEVEKTAEFKASLLGQAGQALLLADKAEAADRLLTAAIELNPADATLWVDRAQAVAARGGFGNAIRDLDQAHVLDPRDADTLVFRASAFRQLGRLDDAENDLNAALLRNPNHVEGLLERGILARLHNDTAAARRNWLRVIDIDPDSPAARMAQSNLEKMDGGVK